MGPQCPPQEGLPYLFHFTWCPGCSWMFTAPGCLAWCESVMVWPLVSPSTGHGTCVLCQETFSDKLRPGLEDWVAQECLLLAPCLGEKGSSSRWMQTPMCQVVSGPKNRPWPVLFSNMGITNEEQKWHEGKGLSFLIWALVFPLFPLDWIQVVWSLPGFYLGPVIPVQDGEDVGINKRFPLST